MIIKFSTPSVTGVWSEDSKQFTCTEPGFAAFVGSTTGEVAFNYWTPVSAGLDTPWQAYMTVGHCWRIWFNDVPRVGPVPEPPGGYEAEGPLN